MLILADAPSQALDWTALVLLAAASSVSFAMIRQGRGAAGLPGCGGGSGCDAVARSRWSRWGPIPVATLGAVIYLLLFALVLASGLAAWRPLSAGLETSLQGIAWAVAGSAVWFTFLQIFVIRRLCPYCVAMHAASLIAAVAVVINHPTAGSLLSVAHLSAALLIALLIGGQVILTPRRYSVTSVPASAVQQLPIQTPSPVDSQTSPLSPRPLSGRTVRLHAGRLNLQLDDWPLLGSPSAPHVIGWFFDHTCKECHHQHRLLREVLTGFRGNVAVIAIPVPMHAACNPTVTCKEQSRAQACALARLCWAVWCANPAKYDDWDRYMSQSEESQPFGLAVQAASQRVDVSVFQLREADPVLDPLIGRGVEAYRSSGTDGVPAILLRNGILRGHVADASGLAAIIAKHFRG